MVKPFRFERSVVLPATPEAVFEFHEDPRNIARIAPASLRVRHVESSLPARAGDRFEIDVVQFGIPLHWTGEWESVERPVRLVDIAVRSPFASWRHEHILEPHVDGCLLTDRVACVPKGGFAGRALGGLFLPLIFGPMFRARHEETLRWFAITRARPSVG